MVLDVLMRTLDAAECCASTKPGRFPLVFFLTHDREKGNESEVIARLRSPSSAELCSLRDGIRGSNLSRLGPEWPPRYPRLGPDFQTWPGWGSLPRLDPE